MVQSPPPQQGFDTAKLYMWVKGLESKVNNLVREVNLLKNDLMRKNLELRKESKTLSEDFLEFKHQQEKMNRKMDLIISELKKTAGVEELMVLKKYVEYWNPLNFVTQRDLEKAIDSRLALSVKEEKAEKVMKKEHHPFG